MENRKVKITECLKKLGIAAHLAGYHYLREAVAMVMIEIENKNIAETGKVTQKIYPAIAETFQTSVTSVERAIRHAIEYAMLYGPMEYIEEIFGMVIREDKGKPTNYAFIATVADYLIMHQEG